MTSLLIGNANLFFLLPWCYPKDLFLLFCNICF